MKFPVQRIQKVRPAELVYEQLRSYLEATAEVGYKLPSSEQLMKRFGVSRPTVVKALDRLEAEGWLECVRGSGYFIARSKAPVRQSVAILYDLDLANHPNVYTHLRMIQECQRALTQRGESFRVYLGTHPHGTPSDTITTPGLMDDLRRGNLRGILDLSGRPVPCLTELAREKNVPLLGVGRYYQHGVTYDFEAFFRKAIHVARRHHRTRIAFSTMRYLHSEVASDHQRACSLLREEGFSTPPEWVREDWHESWQGGGWASFRSIWSSRPEKPDALIVATPPFVEDVHLAARDLGITIPDDLLVIAACAQGTATLNRFRIPKIEENMVRKADALCDMLEAHLRGESPVPAKQWLDLWDIRDPYEDPVSPLAGTPAKEEIPSERAVP